MLPIDRQSIGSDFKQKKPQIIQLTQEDENIEVLWLYGSYANGTAHEIVILTL